jgi:hypothetical protein
VRTLDQLDQFVAGWSEISGPGRQHHDVGARDDFGSGDVLDA